MSRSTLSPAFDQAKKRHHGLEAPDTALPPLIEFHEAGLASKLKTFDSLVLGEAVVGSAAGEAVLPIQGVGKGTGNRPVVLDAGE